MNCTRRREPLASTLRQTLLAPEGAAIIVAYRHVAASYLWVAPGHALAAVAETRLESAGVVAEVVVVGYTVAFDTFDAVVVHVVAVHVVVAHVVVAHVAVAHVVVARAAVECVAVVSVVDECAAVVRVADEQVVEVNVVDEHVAVTHAVDGSSAAVGTEVDNLSAVVQSAGDNFDVVVVPVLDSRPGVVRGNLDAAAVHCSFGAGGKPNGAISLPPVASASVVPSLKSRCHWE